MLPTDAETTTDGLLTTTQVAQIASVSRTTVHRWVAAGLLPVAFRIPSGHRRNRRSDIERLLNGTADTEAAS